MFLYPHFHLLRAIVISNGWITLNVEKFDLLTGQEIAPKKLFSCKMASLHILLYGYSSCYIRRLQQKE